MATKTKTSKGYETPEETVARAQKLLGTTQPTKVGTVAGKNARGGIDKVSNKELAGTRVQGSTGIPGTKTYKEVGILSSNMGKNIVKEADKTLSTLTPEPISATPTTPTTASPEAPAAPAPTSQPQAPAPTETPNTETYVNEQTGQESVLRGTAINETNKKALQEQGYTLASAETTTPQKSPELVRLEGEAKVLGDTVSAFLTKLESSLISDKELRSDINGIKSTYNARIKQAEQITERRIQSLNTLGTRLGARYTGGTNGILGGIISEEESQGLQRITAIENEKQDKIRAAKESARSYNYNAYTKLINEAKELQKTKAEEVANLKKLQEEKDAEIAEQAKLAEYDLLVAEQLSSGVKDPIQLFTNLAGKVPYDHIKDMTDALVAETKPVTLSKDEILVDPKTGKVIARGVKGTVSDGTTTISLPPGVTGITQTMFSSIKEALAGMKFNTVDERKQANAIVGDKLAKGDIEGAKRLLLQYAKNSYGETQGAVIVGYQNGLESLDTIESGLKTLEDAGIDTNIFTGIAQGTANKLGEAELKGLGDPKLAKVANDISLAIISFRRAVSGAAFTESEGKAYEEVFPSIGKSKELNAQKIESLKENFVNGMDGFLSNRIVNYDAIFKQNQIEKPKEEELGNADFLNTGPWADTQNQAVSNEDFFKNY